MTRKITSTKLVGFSFLSLEETKPKQPEKVSNFLYKFDPEVDLLRFNVNAIYGTRRENAFFKIEATVLG